MVLRILRVCVVVVATASLVLAQPGNGNATGNPNNGNPGQGNSGSQGNAGGAGNPNNGNPGQGNGGSQGNAGGAGNPNNGNPGQGNSGSQGNAGGSAAVGAPGVGAPPRANNNPLARRRQTRAHNGEYHVVISGTVQGSGQATVRDDSVSFTLIVTSADGMSGTFAAEGLLIDGPYFSGQATLLGEVVLVRGRVDAARSSRLVATFRGDATHIGRVIGSLPGDAAEPQWDQE
jgi:hypothetical protein